MDKLYSFYDVKAGVLAPPMVYKNDEVAIRACAEMVLSLKANIPLVKYPQDFNLVCVGEWDEVKGAITCERYTVNTIQEIITSMSAKHKEYARIFAAVYDQILKEENKNEVSNTVSEKSN